jgi:hypothetical protein
MSDLWDDLFERREEVGEDGQSAGGPDEVVEGEVNPDFWFDHK